MGSLLDLGSEYTRMIRKRIGPATKTQRDLVVTNNNNNEHSHLQDTSLTKSESNGAPLTVIDDHVSPETCLVSDINETMSLNDPKYVPNPCSNFPKASSSAVVPLQAPNPSKMKVPCIFCGDGVSQENINPDVGHAHNQEFRRMLKVLYRNFQLNPNDVPLDCTEKMFPFCKTCQHDVSEVYREQRAIDEAKKRIGNYLSNIEKNVAEMELLKPKSIVKTEKTECTKLTDKILEGIRCKLLMQKLLRKSGKPIGQEHSFGTPLTLPSHSANVVVAENASRIRGQFEEAKKDFKLNASKIFEDSAESSSSKPGSSRAAKMSRMTIDVSPADVCPDLDQETEQTSQTQQENVDASDLVIGQYNETSCTMVISDVRSESGNGSGPATPAVQDIEDEEVVFVKKEERSPSDEAEREQDFSRRKRSIFRGVNIYRIRDPAGNSLQCGVCHLLIPITDACYPGSSPYDRMTQHIMTEHDCRVQPRRALGRLRGPQRIFSTRRTFSSSAAPMVASAATASNYNGESFPLRRRSQRSIDYPCQNCPEKFPSKLLRREHNALIHKSSPRKAYDNPTNVYQQVCQIMDCDICGKPIRGSHINMMAHKFSHKNDEERKIAIAANEPGSRKSMLTRNGIGLNKRKGGGTRTRGPGKQGRRKYRKRSKFLLGGNFANNGGRSVANNNSEWKCDLCHRLFSKQNHYTNHMKMHARKQDHTRATWTDRVSSPLPPVSGSNSNMTVAARVPPLTIEREVFYARNMNGEEVVIGEKFSTGGNVEVYNDRAC